MNSMNSPKAKPKDPTALDWRLISQLKDLFANLPQGFVRQQPQLKPLALST